MARAGKPAHILSLLLREGAAVVAVGLMLGLGGAVVATRLLGSMLFNVQPSDPATYCWITALMTGSAALACLVPALRVTRVDPLVALRQD